MNKAVILHGTEGSPEGNWFRWLEKELQAKGFDVWLPQLPRARKPSLHEWRNFVQENCPFPIDEETVLVGHSSGAVLALAVAGSGERRLGALVVVAPFIPADKPYVATEWEANSKLFDEEIGWNAIRTNVEKRLIVCSDNDPYIPFEVFRSIASEVKAEMVMVPDQGHFNLEKSEAYREFPLLFGLLMERGIVSHGTIQIVDENDVPVGGATMQEAQAKGLWHRIVRVMVEDGEGNVLLQKRAPTMFMNPDRWDNSCSGHVDLGEDWLAAARRELNEEIGLSGAELTEWRRYKREVHESDGRILRRFNVLYRTIVPHETTFSAQPEEVSEVKWFSKKELGDLIRQHPESVTHGLQKIFEEFYENN